MDAAAQLELEGCSDDPRERADHRPDQCSGGSANDAAQDVAERESDACAKHGPDYSAKYGVSPIGVLQQAPHP